MLVSSTVDSTDSLRPLLSQSGSVMRDSDGAALDSVAKFTIPSQ